MTKNLNLLFYLKKSKVNANNEAPIYLRITVGGKRAETSTSRRIDIKKWSKSGHKGIGRSESIRSLNEYLNLLTSKVYKIHKDLIEEEIDFDANSIKNILSGANKKSKTIIEVFQAHNKQLKQLEGKQYTKATVKRYETALKHVHSFIIYNYSINDLPLNKINHKFITDFQFYLMNVKDQSHNTALKYIKNFKKIVKIALDNDWINKDPFSRFKRSFKKVDREILTQEEIDLIIGKDLKIPRLDLVRDIFLFSCYTGLAYVDVKLLSENDIVIGMNGEKAIHIKRKKTNTVSKIPLLPYAETIINKYQNNPTVLNSGTLLPVKSNQKLNAYLKELTDLCGIIKNITFHTARHTFATTITMANGVSTESISKMLGHKSLRTTQHYAKILDITVSQDMAKLKMKLSVKSEDSENSLTEAI
ncbi:site-specific integrase [Lutimonas vermicola]|uniref:Site-specific integrase n=1 Tax=Lutimonas vermicola TaxID=414288 RepID=A0ABU9L2M3_9FLAO